MAVPEPNPNTASPAASPTVPPVNDHLEEGALRAEAQKVAQVVAEFREAGRLDDAGVVAAGIQGRFGCYWLFFGAYEEPGDLADPANRQAIRQDVKERQYTLVVFAHAGKTWQGLALGCGD